MDLTGFIFFYLKKKHLLYIVIAMILLAVIPNITLAQRKKIVFIAGTKEYGSPGRHEYENGLRDFAACLKNSVDLKNDIETEVYVGKAPKDLDKLKDDSVYLMKA